MNTLDKLVILCGLAVLAVGVTSDYTALTMIGAFLMLAGFVDHMRSN